jgi:Forkhead domain
MSLYPVTFHSNNTSPLISFDLPSLLTMTSPPMPSITSPFENDAKPQIYCVDIAYDNLDSLATPPKLETDDKAMPPSIIETGHASRSLTGSPWSPTQLQTNHEDASFYSVGHMSMFQHQPDLIARSASSPNTLAHFPCTAAFEYPAASPAMSDFRHTDMSDYQEPDYSPRLDGLPNLPFYSNRSSPYPNLIQQDIQAHLLPLSPSSQWMDQQLDDNTVNETVSTTTDGIDQHPPYAQWLYDCLRQAPGHQMVLRDIYAWGKQNIPKVKEALAEDQNAKGWQNSIRHNLSMNQV